MQSIKEQTFQDWELIVVDDGSTDDTCTRISGWDPRLKIIRQKNQGVTSARNTGILQSTGQYIAFLDSDDEWLPFHLELCVAFLQAYPNEHFLTAEFWENFGHGRFVKHHRVEISEWYPETARQYGSQMLDLPAGQDDGYLRVYQSREPIGDWGRQIVDKTGYQDLYHYRGWTFEYWRWGWLTCLQPTVVTRHAVEKVGLFDNQYPFASDFDWLIKVSRHFQANCLSIPTAIKHEYAVNGCLPSEGHIATGKNRIYVAREVLKCFDEYYWNNCPHDPDRSAIRSHRQFWVGRVAMQNGGYAEALDHFEKALQSFPSLSEAKILRLILKWIPSHKLACQAGTLFYFHVLKLWKRIGKALRRHQGVA